MAKNCKIDVQAIKELEDQLKSFRDGQVQQFIDACAKELTARLLAKTVKRTPVGVYPKSTGKVGGTLRKGWTAGKQAAEYIGSLQIRHDGSNTVIEITNPTPYASYVEYGHRTKNGAGWVDGRFMLTKSAEEIQNAAPQIIEAKLKKELGGIFK